MKRDVTECGCLSYLSKSESRVQEVCRTLTAITYPRIEMGLCYDGLCHEVATDKRLQGRHLDHR